MFNYYGILVKNVIFSLHLMVEGSIKSTLTVLINNDDNTRGYENAGTFPSISILSYFKTFN